MLSETTHRTQWKNNHKSLIINNLNTTKLPRELNISSQNWSNLFYGLANYQTTFVM